MRGRDMPKAEAAKFLWHRTPLRSTAFAPLHLQLLIPYGPDVSLAARWAVAGGLGRKGPGIKVFPGACKRERERVLSVGREMGARQGKLGSEPLAIGRIT